MGFVGSWFLNCSWFMMPPYIFLGKVYFVKCSKWWLLSPPTCWAVCGIFRVPLCICESDEFTDTPASQWPDSTCWGMVRAYEYIVIYVNCIAHSEDRHCHQLYSQLSYLVSIVFLIWELEERKNCESVF